MKHIKYILLALLFVFIQSCDLTDDPAITGTNTQSMAGEWYLELLGLDSSVAVGHSLHTTSNTAANLPNEMWFSDGGHVYHHQNKIDVNTATGTFSATNAINILYSGLTGTPTGTPVVALGTVKAFTSGDPERITITDGKISQETFIAPSKTRTDYFSCNITYILRTVSFTAASYSINGTDTTVVWNRGSEMDEPDGPYILAGYRRTGFLEDEH
ncbi:MAG: hypothetical protein M3Q56_08685 [Bacteroidota bacterium]|nr:hypothetical protein [Bacteroidota bacterium]